MLSLQVHGALFLLPTFARSRKPASKVFYEIKEHNEGPPRPHVFDGVCGGRGRGVTIVRK